MNRTVIQEFAFPILLLFASGCRDSAKPVTSSLPSPTPAAQPAPAAVRNPLSATQQPSYAVAKAKPSAPPPPLSTMIPVKTFEVKPPQSFDADQIPTGQAVMFEVLAEAGRILQIETEEGYRLSVHSPGNRSKQLTGGGDSEGHSFYALPEAGLYKVLYAPTRTAKIKFSFVAADNPRFDPVIKPKRFSIDFGALAENDELTVLPYTFYEDEGILDSWPTHLGIMHGQFEFHIMSVAGYKSVFQEHESATLLQSILLNDGKNARVEELPYALTGRWCAYVMTLRKQVLQGDGWRGLRWIGGFGGDEEYPSCGLGYVFTGISNDGRYLIVLRADISHPDRKRLLPPRQINGSPGHTWESVDSKVDKEMSLQLKKTLSAADPASFEPSLDQLDAVIKSLKLK